VPISCAHAATQASGAFQFTATSVKLKAAASSFQHFGPRQPWSGSVGARPFKSALAPPAMKPGGGDGHVAFRERVAGPPAGRYEGGDERRH